MRMEAGMGTRKPQTKACRHHQKPEKAREGPPRQVSEGAIAALILDFEPPAAPCLWSSVTACAKQIQQVLCVWGFFFYPPSFAVLSL